MTTSSPSSTSIPSTLASSSEKQDLPTGKTNLVCRPVGPDELEEVYKLESAGFPADEAASLSTIQYRQTEAPELFLGAYHENKLIGFINATSSANDNLDHHSLTHHDPSGKNVLIHSVCVDINHRRAKVATDMLLDYIHRCYQAGFLSIVLVCHEELKSLYMNVGFVDRGPSQLVHGSQPWFEMFLDLQTKNPKKLLCPKERCRCIILRAGIARPTIKRECPLPVIPGSSKSVLTSCWSVPHPTSFENIGFSYPVAQDNSQPTLNEKRWLVCGACDFGPLGWTESSSNLAQQFSNNPTGRFGKVLFLLACDRVVPAD